MKGMETDEQKLDANTEAAIDHIDAALFTGDTFFRRPAIARLREFLARWERGLVEAEATIAPDDEPGAETAEVLRSEVFACYSLSIEGPAEADYAKRTLEEIRKIDGVVVITPLETSLTWKPVGEEPAPGMPRFEVVDDTRGLVYALRGGVWFVLRTPSVPSARIGA